MDALPALGLELQRRAAYALLHAPPRLLRALVGPEKRSPEGHVLDLQMQVLIYINERLGGALDATEDPVEARKRMDEGSRLITPRVSPAPAHEDRRIPVENGSLPVRIYTPPSAGSAPLPVVVFFHGGGFSRGSLVSHHGECQGLAVKAEAIVVAVDYRLAPEHRFPAAVDDALAAFRWVAEHAATFGGDPTRIAVAGDSAGGNLAAVVARETRGDAHKPVFQLLVYPATDMTRSLPSHRHFREGFFLTEASINIFLAAYLNSEAEQRDPRASPLLAGDHGGQPPAMVLTAGFDPLRDEGDAYAKALAEAGVPVEHRSYEGLIHGFFNMSAMVDAAHHGFDDAARALRRALHPLG
ncbi:putative lipase [Chondromyces apiculatus DSM 436]|uniref:Putative lipase n=1 Tax=Chondromyces apiculatus DSM 436 TaxID=1192034 RepID=A0A017T7S8_9BACT|nr:putative lipase [Chondromyces apiculatus DSM 436]